MTTSDMPSVYGSLNQTHFPSSYQEISKSQHNEKQLALWKWNSAVQPIILQLQSPISLEKYGICHPFYSKTEFAMK